MTTNKALQDLQLTEEKALWVYETMNNIRNFEDTLHKHFSAGLIPGFVHLYAGEEAIATGVCANLTDADYITSTHRGHGHCIAKGCDINGMMAEIYGREDGLCKGKGGSMHIADVDKGMLGANGIVGGGFPIAVGAGITSKYLNNQSVAVCFFGDGASNEGTFHEGINMAASMKLPVVFVCENNGFAEATPIRYSSASKTIADRAKAYGIPGIRVDGNDLVAVYTAAKEAIDNARAGKGPTIIECVTYRNYGHFEGDEQKYKTNKEKKLHPVDKDPINLFKEYAIENNLLTKKQLTAIEKKSVKTIKEAVEFAQNSPIPKPESLLTDVFAD